VAECPLHKDEREKAALNGINSWEETDQEVWVPDPDSDNPNDRIDAVEGFFGYLGHQF